MQYIITIIQMKTIEISLSNEIIQPIVKSCSGVNTTIISPGEMAHLPMTGTLGCRNHLDALFPKVLSTIIFVPMGVHLQETHSFKDIQPSSRKWTTTILG